MKELSFELSLMSKRNLSVLRTPEPSEGLEEVQAPLGKGVYLVSLGGLATGMNRKRAGAATSGDSMHPFLCGKR